MQATVFQGGGFVLRRRHHLLSVTDHEGVMELLQGRNIALIGPQGISSSDAARRAGMDRDMIHTARLYWDQTDPSHQWLVLLHPDGVEI